MEATAYFVGCEGLTNVIKHAQASAVTLRAQRRDGSLLVSVADDGVGGATPGAGSGLVGLADRVAAAVACCGSTPARSGTTVTAELPCG